MEIRGSTAVVTGGGSGLGEATARELVARGAQVGILDLERSNGAELAKALGPGARFLPADVTDETAVAGALDRAASELGTPSILVNCAGIGTPGRVVDKKGEPLDLGVFRRVVEVNLIGTFNVVRLAAARMRVNTPNAAGERGVVVNTASIAAYEGQIGQAAYAASKGGVVGLTLPVARDLAGSGIRVCTIAPGLFGTPMLMGLPEPAREALAASIPFPPRLGEPAEYAALACHIVENPMLNGETIRLDGALRMQPR
jgi:NAD(P)-dependent dehydrogenase (short-subunit alcohol dehydrogenase family)